MITEDFYTGEPVITGSPNNFSISQDNIISTKDDAEAANMASFARSKYDFDPSTRAVGYPSMITPGGYGYYPQQYPLQQGIGMSPYGNILPSYGGYRGYYQQPYYQYPQNGFIQPPQQPTTVHVSGVGIGGEFMPPSDYQERIDKIQQDFWLAQQELEAKGIVDRQSRGIYNTGYGFNYYGIPYYTNTYQYNSINNGLQKQLDLLKDEARENRMSFQLKISQLAHNFAGDGLSDDKISRRYIGYDMDIPQGIIPTIQEYQEQARFANLIPFDNSQKYREFHAAVSKEFHDIVKEDGNLQETFASMGVVQANWEMEEEMHRRKNAGGLYNSTDNSYKYFVRKKAQERYAQEQGIVLPGSTPVPSINQMAQSFVNNTPVLNGATIKDDGTLVLPCNFGSHAGQMYSVHNSQEAEYNAKRERFGKFLDSIPGNIYLDAQKEKKFGEYKNG